MHGAILLADHHYIGTPRRCCRLHDVMSEHVVNMFVNEGQLCGGVALHFLEVGYIVASVNAVRYDTGTTNFVVRTREDIRPGLDEGFHSSTLLSCHVFR